MPLTRSEEMAIRGAAAAAQALAQSLSALVAREIPQEPVPTCPGCHGTDLAEAGDVLVCADCNTNIPR
jgi:cytochrome c553